MCIFTVIAPCYADVTLIVDSSGSIEDVAPGNWQLVKNFATDIVRRLDIGNEKNRVAGVIYSTLAYLRFDFGAYNDQQSIINDINGWFHLNGHTNTTGAFMEYLNKLTLPSSGQRLEIQDVIILITDGNTTRSKEGLVGNVTAAKAFGAYIIGVGVGKIDLEEMRRIVSYPFEANYFGVSQFSNLLSVLDNVIQSANCPRATIPPVSALPEGILLVLMVKHVQPVFNRTLSLLTYFILNKFVNSTICV